MSPLAFKIGECEATHLNGGGKNVKIFPAHHNMWLCKECLDEEIASVARTSKVVEDARKVDSDIQVKADLFKAGTIPFVEISAAVNQNPSIADADKKFKILDEATARIKHLSEVIFNMKAELVAVENQRYAIQVNAQALAATLHEKDRAKYKTLDVNYKPNVVKTPTKPTVAKTPVIKFSKKALMEAVAKYPGVPLVSVQRLSVSKNLSCEDAAKIVATNMGLI
jgi:hypothetical protein